MNTKKVIRKFKDTFFILTDARLVEYFGKKYKSAYWLECDEEGNVKDSNGNGVIENKTILCKIPDGHEDIDLSTLQDDCLQ